MKPKNPTNRRVRKDAVAVDPRSGDERQRVIIDFVQRRIETYNQELGGGVAVRKDRGGYTLIREDIGIPTRSASPERREGRQLRGALLEQKQRALAADRRVGHHHAKPG